MVDLIEDEDVQVSPSVRGHMTVMWSTSGELVVQIEICWLGIFMYMGNHVASYLGHPLIFSVSACDIADFD